MLFGAVVGIEFTRSCHVYMDTKLRKRVSYVKKLGIFGCVC
jgi:hypothetical protein